MEQQLSQTHPSTAGGGEVILVVDDDADVRDVTALVLATEGFRVLEAGGGEEALELAEKLAGRVDLVITDVRMPRMDGSVLAQELHRRWPAMPVLFITGYAGMAMTPDDPDYGISPHDQVLTKPFEMEDLLARIRSLLPPPHEHAH